VTGLWLISYVALWVLFLVVAVLLISTLYHLGVIYSRIEHRVPPPTKLVRGEILPDVALQAPDGHQIQASQFAGSKTAFVIISPGCSSCLMILEEIARGDNSMKLPVERTVIVSLSDVPATLEMVRRAQLPPGHAILADTNNILKERWGIRATPVIVETDEELKISEQRVVLG
jgi:hypothetical protein